MAALLRVMGVHHEQQFPNDHRVLNRAPWSSRAVSRMVLVLPGQRVVPATAPVVRGSDETIERRRGEKMAARGISRDAVRSSTRVVVKTSGLRWISMMLLTPIPWAQRVWALPFLTVLAPSERFHVQCGTTQTTITDGTRQMILPVHRWLPTQAPVMVGDGSSAVVAFLAPMVRVPLVTMITRLRLDAALSDPAPARATGTNKNGRPALTGTRQPTLATRRGDPHTVWQHGTVSWYGDISRHVALAPGPALWSHAGIPPVPMRWGLVHDPEGTCTSQAVRCTDHHADPLQILACCVMRWPVEVTVHDVRTPLGVQTPRPWSDLAMVRTTPVLLGRCSLVTLCAQHRVDDAPFPVRQAAWSSKALPPFSETLACVRQQVWPASFFGLSTSPHEVVTILRALFERVVETLAFTA